jgi:hypothetical protein
MEKAEVDLQIATEKNSGRVLDVSVGEAEPKMVKNSYEHH